MVFGASGKQEQKGDGGRNYQAGRDIVIGSNLEDMRKVALDVYRENALELRGLAEDVAYARADRLTQNFLEKVNVENSQAMNSLSDPDMQSVLFEAQSQYARSGEEDLGNLLVDLLVDRAGEAERSLGTLALNEAIHSAPKLTESQRRVIGLIFILKYTRTTVGGNAQALFDDFVRKSVLPLGGELPERQIDYQHIEYVGAGTNSISRVTFAQVFLGNYEGLYTNGFGIDQIPPDWDREDLASYGIRPALRGGENLQVDARGSGDIKELARRVGREEIAEDLEELMKVGLMTEDEVVEDLAAYDPEVRELARRWDESAACGLTLTSVGIAIGHGYWRRVTGMDAPLSIWL